MCTLGARGFSYAVSGFGQVSAADETKLTVAREKKPLVPRVCGVRTTQKVKSLGFVSSTLSFLSPRCASLFSCGVILTYTRVSLALLSLRENEGLLVV